MDVCVAIKLFHFHQEFYLSIKRRHKQQEKKTSIVVVAACTVVVIILIDQARNDYFSSLTDKKDHDSDNFS